MAFKLLCFLTVIACATAAGLLTTECTQEVKDFFTSRNFKEGAEFVQNQGDICGSSVSGTCCPQRLQQTILRRAPEDLHKELHFIRPFRQSLREIEKSIKESYATALDSARKHAQDVLINDLKFTKHNDTLNALFNSLRLYLFDIRTEIAPKHVENSVHKVFSDLFISVFFQTANPPKIKDFSDDYKSCLRRQTSVIMPFGDYPQRLATYFAKSFEAARVLLRSTKELGEVLVVANQVNVTYHGECSKALAKVYYCPTCKGLVEVKPCYGLCLNVMRGCLAPLSDIDTPWTSLVDKTIVLIKRAQATNYHVDHALLILSKRITDAVTNAMENGLDIVKRVKQNCGEPQGSSLPLQHFSKRSAGGILRSTVPENLLSDTSKILSADLESLLARLAEIRDLFGTLGERLCGTNQANSNCWTGERVGEYRKTLAGRGVNAQKLNPEVAFNEHQTPNFVALVDHSLQLKLMANQIGQAGVMKLKPESDNYQVETRHKDLLGEGAESGDDLEDGYSSGDEGSGSGHHPIDDTETGDSDSRSSSPNSDLAPSEPPSILKEGSSSSSSSSDLITPLLLTLTALALIRR